MPDDPLAQLDLGLSALFAGQTIADEVRDRIEERGFIGLRVSHGFLVQRLIERERPIFDLADSLGVTQQAISKTVAVQKYIVNSGSLISPPALATIISPPIT